MFRAQPIHLLNLLRHLGISCHRLPMWHGHYNVVEAECVACIQLFHEIVRIIIQLLKYSTKLKPSNQYQIMHHSIEQLQINNIFYLASISSEHAGLTPCLT